MHDHDSGVNATRRFPALAPWLSFDFERDRVMFRNGEMIAVMEGPGVSRYVAAVTPLLDGHHSVEEIAGATDIGLDRVRQVVAVLENADLIVDGEGFPADESCLDCAAVAASCWGQLVDVPRAAERLAAARVAIAGADPVTRSIAEQLVEMGVACALLADASTLEGELPDAALESDVVVVGPSVVHLMARSINRALYEAQVTWLPVFPFNGRYAQVGPLVVPPDSGCFECYVLRRHANVTYGPGLYDDVARAGVKSAAEFPPLDRAAAATAAFVVQQWLAVRHPEMPGAIHLEHAGTWKRETHHLLRVPRCPVCSPAADRGIPASWWSAP